MQSSTAEAESGSFNDRQEEADVGTLVLPADIDWDALMKDSSPPEWDLLLSAAAQNDMDSMKDLGHNKGVSVLHSNTIGQTALHVAVLWGHVGCARFLLSAGADANAANKMSGATPLHMTLQSRKTTDEMKLEIVTMLMEVGRADPGIRDSIGKYPLDYINKNSLLRATLKPRLKPPPLDESQLRSLFFRDMQSEGSTCRRAT